MTRTSWAGLIHRLKYPGIGGQFLSQSNCLFRLAKQNGFRTHFIYAQDRGVIDTLLPLMCANYIDSIRASTDAPPEMQDLDESLAYHLADIDLTSTNFILIGPNGAHTPYADKSPEAFKKFDDDYDNAIHYTDHIVAELINYLQKQSTKPTYIIHTSDHGELLKGEDSRRGHGWFKGKVIKVPFFFLALNEPTSGDLMTEVGKVKSHFDVATLLIKLMGYDVAVEDTADKEIFINGSDMSGLAGHMRLQLIDGKLSTVELINSTDDTPLLEDVSLLR